jgi:ABC-type nitrate/sulfonate/bicarbonate transport system permease component
MVQNPLGRVGRSFWSGLAGAVALLLFWDIAASHGLIPYLKTPVEVAQDVGNQRGLLFENATYTFVRATLGLGIGSVSGVVAALAMGWNRYLRAFAAPPILAGKAVPVLALIPIFILWFGTGETSIVLFIALGCFFILFVVSMEAIANVPNVYVWAASSLGTSPLDTYWRVVLPAISVGIIGGLRVAATNAFPLGLAAEFLGAQHGLGFYVIKATAQLQVSAMIAGVLGISVLAVIADTAVRLTSRKLTAWSEREAR